MTQGPPPADVRRLVVVRGRVQGVGFRASCAARADRLGVTGWVRNRADGAVEALCHGPEAAVAALVAWCREGPPLARVTDVTVTDVTGTDVTVTDVPAGGPPQWGPSAGDGRWGSGFAVR